MLLLKRPHEPSHFAKTIGRHKTAVERHINELLKAKTTPASAVPTLAAPTLSSSSGKRKKKKSDVFASKWTNFKDVFSKAQYGRCGYCEVSVIGAQHGDVDHFYPKGRVDRLLDDPDTWGREKPYLSNVEGRKPDAVSDIGYWWLAYEWTNYILCCLVCNEYWKGAIFPVENNPRKVPPTSDASEAALLLNPFENVNPAEHICFNEWGQIYPYNSSRRGFELIRTCGLDRESLRNIRQGIAREVHALCNKVNSPRTADEFKASLHSLYLKGVETNHHPGMVRIIVERRCELTWRDLVHDLVQLFAVDLQNASAPNELRDLLLTLYQMGDERYEHSDLVREIVSTECGKNWESLVEELTSSLIDAWITNNSNSEGASALTFIHEMGKDGQSHTGVVRDMVRRKTGLGWPGVVSRVRAGPSVGRV